MALGGKKPPKTVKGRKGMKKKTAMRGKKKSVARNAGRRVR